MHNNPKVSSLTLSGGTTFSLSNNPTKSSVTLSDGTTIYTDYPEVSPYHPINNYYTNRNFVEALESGKCDALATNFSHKIASLNSYKTINNYAFLTSEMANFTIEHLSCKSAENLSYREMLMIKMLKEGFDCVTFDQEFEEEYAFRAEDIIEVHTPNESDYQDAASFLCGLNPENTFEL